MVVLLYILSILNHFLLEYSLENFVASYSLPIVIINISVISNSFIHFHEIQEHNVEHLKSFYNDEVLTLHL